MVHPRLHVTLYSGSKYLLFCRRENYRGSCCGVSRGCCGFIPKDILRRAADAAHDATHNTRSRSGSAVLSESFAVSKRDTRCKPFADLLHGLSKCFRERAFAHTPYGGAY